MNKKLFKMSSCYIVLILLVSPAWCGMTVLHYKHGKSVSQKYNIHKRMDVINNSFISNSTDNPHDEDAGDDLGIGEVDILRLLNVSGAVTGVNEVEGPSPGVPAYKFKTNYANVQVLNTKPIIKALTSSSGFTITFVYRQQKKTLGTLLSVHSPGRVTPWFQIASNLRTGQLVMHYRLNSDKKLHSLSWPLLQFRKFHDEKLLGIHEKKGLNGWTHLAISVDPNTNTVTLKLDCQPSQTAVLSSNNSRARHVSLDIPEHALVYFRQEPGLKKKFLGSMQVARIVPFASGKKLDWSCNLLGTKKFDHLVLSVP